jgi:hypothetical protein
MIRTLKIGILLGIVPALAWGCGEPAQSPHGSAGSHATEAPAAPDTVPAAAEAPERSPFDGHYERMVAGKDKDKKDKDKKKDEDEASLDILQVGPGIVRVKGFAEWVGNAETGNVNTGEISGTAKLDRLKAHFENADGCTLDILFQADGLKVENATDCGGLNVTFDGEYTRTGPSELGRNPGGH